MRRQGSDAKRRPGDRSFHLSSVHRTKPGVAFLPPSAQTSRTACIALGASQTEIDLVVGAAVDFVTWRLYDFDGRGDTAEAASTWSLLQRDQARSARLGSTQMTALTRAERDAVRWALARFANLLRSEVSREAAVEEAVTIPLEASSAWDLSWEEWAERKRKGISNFERDNVVPGTVPVWARNAAEFQSQRIYARRLLTVDRAGSWHQGWLSVPELLSVRFGWEIVSGDI